MTGLKSGSGDDLWGDESDETDEVDEEDAERESEAESATDSDQSTPSEENDQTEKTLDESTTDTISESESSPSSSQSTSGQSASQQPYIVRRAVQDKSVQFERDERLTFFVHDDVVDGERNLITDVESELGRAVPKFDVREAVYRAALRNRADILEELIKMGYSADDNS